MRYNSFQSFELFFNFNKGEETMEERFEELSMAELIEFRQKAIKEKEELESLQKRLLASANKLSGWSMVLVSKMSSSANNLEWRMNELESKISKLNQEIYKRSGEKNYDDEFQAWLENISGV